ncbi:MAG: hypothetical protein ACK41T_00645 [Pseudobdellovibrio sp.]
MTLKISELIAAVFTLLSLTATIILWSENRYQSKQDAQKYEAYNDGRVSKVEAEVTDIKRNTNQIAVDVSYIRGKLEPK